MRIEPEIPDRELPVVGTDETLWCDEADHPALSRHRWTLRGNDVWNERGQRATEVMGLGRYRVKRAEGEVLDLRRAKLRLRTSAYRHVFMKKETGKWFFVGWRNGKRVWIGPFPTELEALEGLRRSRRQSAPGPDGEPAARMAVPPPDGAA